MTVESYICLRCNGDGCGARTRGVTLGSMPHMGHMARLRSVARTVGWKTMRLRGRADHGDYCPVCVARIEAARAPRTILERWKRQKSG